MLVKPERLYPGDVIGIIAPASAPPDPKNIDQSVAILEHLGFKPKLGAHARQRWGFLAGNDRQRAGDLMTMVLDRKVKAILCVRGGYGTARLLSLLDYAKIRAHPKILMGYSDITSLHCAFLRRANLVTFHGPMLSSDLIQETMPAFTLRGLLRTLTLAAPAGSIAQGYRKHTVQVLRRGRAAGRLLGGNLSLLCTTLGTPFQPDFRKAILLIEDLDEKPYRFDRMLTHLLNAGCLQQVSGIAVGINAHCEDPKAKTSQEYRQTVEDVLLERLSPLKIPIVSGLPFGHVPHNATLPIGVSARLDAVQGDLVITEAAVR